MPKYRVPFLRGAHAHVLIHLIQHSRQGFAAPPRASHANIAWVRPMAFSSKGCPGLDPGEYRLA